MNQNNGNNKGGGNNRNMMGLISLVLWALVITLSINYFLSLSATAKSTEIPSRWCGRGRYSRF